MSFILPPARSVLPIDPLNNRSPVKRLFSIFKSGSSSISMISASSLGISGSYISRLGRSELVGFAAGGMAVAGHCFPVWHRFRGGKGVATTVGVRLWTISWLGLGLALLWAAIIGMTSLLLGTPLNDEQQEPFNSQDILAGAAEHVA